MDRTAERDLNTPAPAPPKNRAGIVVERRELTSRFYELRLRIDGAPDFTFVAGQSMVVTLDDTRGERPRKARRSYSMSNPPSDLGHVEFCIERIPGGLASNALGALAPGERVALKGPYGRFSIDLASPREILLIATGTGIGPFKSMIEDLFARGSRRRVRLWFGLRFVEDLIYADRLAALAADHANFEPVITLSRPEPGRWDGAVGRVTRLVDERLSASDAEGTDVYLCGSTAMIEDVGARLRVLGFPEERIRFESFF